jgi:hypothetical protein
MKIDVTDLAEEIVYNAREGSQTLKIIEVTEKLDDAKMPFLAIKFVNQWGEYHYEKFYPEKHRKKLYEIACAIDGTTYKDSDGIVLDTKEFVGGFIHCSLENVETQRGEITRTMYIRNIRVSPRRKDTTGSMQFKRVRNKK